MGKGEGEDGLLVSSQFLWVGVNNLAPARLGLVQALP